MRLAPPPLRIGDRDGFEGTDIFGYEEFGKSLSALIESLTGPSVIALDGGWGSGKTVFAKQWAGLLRNRGSAVIYFDAFAADGGDDPLFDIASKLFEAAPEDERRDQFVRAAVTLGRRLGPLAAGVALRATTAGQIGTEEVRETIAAVTEARNAAMERFGDVSVAFRRRIEGAEGRARALADFQRSLTALAVTLQEAAVQTNEENIEASKKKPVAVLIDELDRCRPTYALSLLENLKHVFNTDNLCFVLVTNQAQLAQVVAREYGVEKDRGYLEKFIHATFRLPTDIGAPDRSVREVYVGHLCGKMLSAENGPVIARTLAEVSSAVGLSLRDIEKAVINISMCEKASAMWQFWMGEIQSIVIPVFICVVRALSPERYARLRSFEMTSEDVLDYLKLDTWSIREERRTKYIEMIKSYFPSHEVLEGGLEVRKEWERSGECFRVRDMCRCLDRFGQD